MKCQKVKKVLTTYISDELSKDEHQEIEIHLQTCCSCQRELVSLQAAKEMLSTWDEVDPSEGLFSKFEARWAEEVQRGEPKPFLLFEWLPSKWLYVPAAAACFIAATSFYILRGSSWFHAKDTSPRSAYKLQTTKEMLNARDEVSPYRGMSGKFEMRQPKEVQKSSLPSKQSSSKWPYTSTVAESYGQGDIWVSFYLSEHEKTLKHTAVQEALFSRESSPRMPFRRENILYYDEISGGREKLKGQSGLILKHGSEWQGKEEAEEGSEEALRGEMLTLDEARRAVSFDIVAPSVLRGEYRLAFVRKVKDKECIQLVYSNGAGIVSLFEQPLRGGAQFGRKEFREYILRLAEGKERMAVLGWVTERLSLNLIGEMTPSELMKIAEEIQERGLMDKAKKYYQRLYEGEQDNKMQNSNPGADSSRTEHNRSSG